MGYTYTRYIVVDVIISINNHNEAFLSDSNCNKNKGIKSCDQSRLTVHPKPLHCQEELAWLKKALNYCLKVIVCLTCLRNLFHISLYVYDCNRPLAPILRQKMALSGVWCLLTTWWLMWLHDDWCFTGLRYVEYISRIRTEHTLNNSNTEWKNRIKQKALGGINTESNKSTEKTKSNDR